jgi:hypothetical protein
MTMLYVILGLFAGAALLGMYLISFVLRSKETPKGLVLLHGLFAATSLVLLIFYTINRRPCAIAGVIYDGCVRRLLSRIP